MKEAQKESRREMLLLLSNVAAAISLCEIFPHLALFNFTFFSVFISHFRLPSLPACLTVFKGKAHHGRRQATEKNKRIKKKVYLNNLIRSLT